MHTLGKLTTFGITEEDVIKQAWDIAQDAERVALMADNHFGYHMPIGGVAAYKDKVTVAGVGYDIACGNAAIRTNLTIDEVFGMTLEEMESNPYRFASHRKANEIANEIQNTLSFGIGRRNQADDAPVDHELFVDDAWWIIPNNGPYEAFRDELMEKARRQLGTIGSGNHYVDVFSDEMGCIWVGVHFGSRGLGHTIATSFLALSEGGEWGGGKGFGKSVGLLSMNDQLGQDYWSLMNLCGKYAYAGREWVARKVVGILGGEEQELVHNHHNFAWKEEHYGEAYYVVRKGATPAFPGQKGFVGGSMGDNAVILSGADVDTEFGRGRMGWSEAQGILAQQKAAMFSTVHGAGRVMSRTEAAGKWDYKKKVRKTAGKVSPEMMEAWLRKRGVILRGGGLDEAPQAYRRLEDVLEAQGDTIEIWHQLSPLIVVMAGANEFDPYKD